MGNEILGTMMICKLCGKLRFNTEVEVDSAGAESIVFPNAGFCCRSWDKIVENRQQDHRMTQMRLQREAWAQRQKRPKWTIVSLPGDAR